MRRLRGANGAALGLVLTVAASAWSLPPPTPCPSCWVPPPFTSWLIQFTVDLDQSPTLVPYFDWAVNEQCVQYEECDKLLPFVQAGKAVMEIEYRGNPTRFCPAVNALGFNAMKKRRRLDATRVQCNAGVESP